MSIDTFLFLQNERGYYDDEVAEDEREEEDESHDLFRVDEEKDFSLSSATLKVLCAETSLDFEKIQDFFNKKEYSKKRQQSDSNYKTLRDSLEILSSKEKLPNFLQKGELIERDFRKLVDDSHKTYKIFLSDEKAKEEYEELPSEFKNIDDNNKTYLKLPSCKIIINTAAAPNRYCNHHQPISSSSSSEETASFDKAYSLLLKSCPRKEVGGGHSSDEKPPLCDDLFFEHRNSRFFFSSDGAKILLQKANEVLPRRFDDDDNVEYYQFLLEKIDVLKNYIPPYFIVDPDIIGEITNFPNRDTFPLIILLNAFEWCLSRIVERPFSLHNMDYVFAKVFTQIIRGANNDFCRAKTYVRHRIFTTVKLFCSAMAKFIRTDYKHENLARSIERDADSFLLSIMRRKNDVGDDDNSSNLFKFIDHKTVCKRDHRYAVYGRFYETIFSNKTSSNLLNLIKETEYKLLLDQNALKNFRFKLRDSLRGYYWWERDDERESAKDVLKRHLMNKRKITFENIEFVSPFPYYFLWGSFFLMASRDFSTPNILALEQQQRGKRCVLSSSFKKTNAFLEANNNGSGDGGRRNIRENNLVLSSKMLLSDFMIHHVYMMVGCSICENNYSQKLKYAMEMSDLVIQHTNTLLREKSGNKKMMSNSSSGSSGSGSSSSTLHILASSLQYKGGGKFIKNKNNNLLQAKDYISYFVEFIFRHEEREERDILQITELKALIYFSSYLSLLLLIIGDPFAQRSIFTEEERKSIFGEKAKGFKYFNSSCHTISLWLLRNVIRLENKSNLFPLNRIIEERNIENFKFGFFEIFFHKKFNLSQYNQYLIQNGFDDIRKLLIRKENEDRWPGDYNNNIEDDDDDDDEDDDEDKKNNKGQTKRLNPPPPSTTTTKKTFSNNSNFFSQFNTEEELLKAKVIPFFKGEINGKIFR